jgi:hypothetical protein
MISETTFASSYASFWNSLAPNAERFVRLLNLNLDRYRDPIPSLSEPHRRGFLNDIAFRNFEWNYRRTEGTSIPRQQIVQEARDYLLKFGSVSESDLGDLSETEWVEVGILIHSTELFATRLKTVDTRSETFQISPKFQGCGIVDSSNGDILIGHTLVEIKAGDRTFRSIDIRQLLTYCALNSLAHKYSIDDVSCVNPRRGVYFFVPLETLCRELAGKSSAEVLAEITYFISSGDLSL